MECEINHEVQTMARRGIKATERKTERTTDRCRAERRMEFNINYGMLAPLVILVITLCTVAIATLCPFCCWHGDGLAICSRHAD